MKSIPIAAIGHLIRDIIYIKNKSDGCTYLIGSRGGGSIWNTLANAAVNGSTAIALCVGGSDEAAELCLEDLRAAGVIIAGKRMVNGKATRTIHEILTFEGSKPRHKCSSICPVCSSNTYNSGTARLSANFISDFGPKLKKAASNGIIIHIDNFNKSRLNMISAIKNKNILISLDLGRLTSFYRMSPEEIIYNLENIDILFINSTLLHKLKKKLAFSSEENILTQTGIKLLISLEGENGINAWVKCEKEVLFIDQNAAEVDYLVDAAGAGDAFIGFFLSRTALRPARDFQDWIKCRDDVEENLFEAQKWAAAKCGFLGARGHIGDNTHPKWNNNFIKYRIINANSVDDLRFKNEGLTKCGICNRSFSEKSPIDRSKISINVLRFHKNVLSLPRNIETSWSHRNETPWRRILELEGQGYVIGTGGSFVVASFIAQLISMKSGNVIMPIKPFDFIRIGLRVPFAIFISNSGKTPDILNAITYARNIKIPELLLVSGNKNLDLIDILREKKDTFLYTGANEDRGFLSVLGVFAPCFLSWAISDKIWFNDIGYRYFNELYLKSEIKANNVFYKYKRDGNFRIAGRKSIILGGGFAWPAMLNIESKMVESNFGRPQISEIKDYSHGRFVSSIDQKVLAIVCGMQDDQDYRKFLVDRLRNRNDVIELVSDEIGPLGSLDLLLQSEHLMKCFAEKENVDISKPKVPKSGLELYRYKNLLSEPM